MNTLQKDRDVLIGYVWKSDFDDVRADILLMENNKVIGEFVASYDLDTNRTYPEMLLKSKIVRLVEKDFDMYKSLPKLSKTSKLMKYIFDSVRESDATMCHIDNEEWEELDFTDRDLKKLRQEIDKYKLNDVITIDENNYKIIGYGNLETSFCDDREYIKSKEKENIR